MASVPSIPSTTIGGNGHPAYDGLDGCHILNLDICQGEELDAVYHCLSDVVEWWGED
jgi:hypothetical protein